MERQGEDVARNQRYGGGASGVKIGAEVAGRYGRQGPRAALLRPNENSEDQRAARKD